MITLVARILLGALFVGAGIQKMQGIEGFAAFMETGPFLALWRGPLRYLKS